MFLSVFKFEERKAWQELVSAFLREFREDEPVTLLLRTSPEPTDAVERYAEDVCRSLNCTQTSVLLPFAAKQPPLLLRRTISILPKACIAQVCTCHRIDLGTTL